MILELRPPTAPMEFQILRRNILHLTSENVLLQLKQCLPS